MGAHPRRQLLILRHPQCQKHLAGLVSSKITKLPIWHQLYSLFPDTIPGANSTKKTTRAPKSPSPTSTRSGQLLAGPSTSSHAAEHIRPLAQREASTCSMEMSASLTSTGTVRGARSATSSALKGLLMITGWRRGIGISRVVLLGVLRWKLGGGIGRFGRVFR